MQEIEVRTKESGKGQNAQYILFRQRVIDFIEQACEAKRRRESHFDSSAASPTGYVGQLLDKAIAETEAALINPSVDHYQI